MSTKMDESHDHKYVYFNKTIVNTDVTFNFKTTTKLPSISVGKQSL